MLLCPKGTALCILWKREKLNIKHVLRSQFPFDILSSNAKDRRLCRYSCTANKGLHVTNPSTLMGHQARIIRREQCYSHSHLPHLIFNTSFTKHKPATTIATKMEGFPCLSEQKALKKVVHFELISSSDLWCCDLNIIAWSMNDRKIPTISS